MVAALQLTTLREKLVKIGAKVTRHSKYVTFQLAEVAVAQNLFAAILGRIERLALPPPVWIGSRLSPYGKCRINGLGPPFPHFSQ